MRKELICQSGVLQRDFWGFLFVILFGGGVVIVLRDVAEYVEIFV